VLRRFASDLERYAFLSELHDNNETLFFALLEENLEELLPLVYTPTVGAGCQQFSQLFRKPARDDPANNLLPPVTALRDVAFAVALATAIQAHQEGLTEGVETGAIEAAIQAKIWSPRYLPYRHADDRTSVGSIASAVP